MAKKKKTPKKSPKKKAKKIAKTAKKVAKKAAPKKAAAKKTAKKAAPVKKAAPIAAKAKKMAAGVAAAAGGAAAAHVLKPAPSRFDDLYKNDKTIDDLDDDLDAPLFEEDEPEEGAEAAAPEEVEEAEETEDDVLNFDENFAPRKGRESFYEDLDMFDNDKDDGDRLNETESIIESDDDDSF